MFGKQPYNPSRPQQQPKRMRYYYQCVCGGSWSKVFEVGDGQPRSCKCHRCKVTNRHVRTFTIKS